MDMQTIIQQKLSQACAPTYLAVENESHMHAGPATESHFKVVIVAECFNGERLLARHRRVNKALADELSGTVHALALHTYTPDEWQEKATAPDSPQCRGGS